MAVKAIGNVRNVGNLESSREIDWADVKDEYIRSVLNKEPTELARSGQPHSRFMSDLMTTGKLYYGCTFDEMRKYLSDGYWPKEFDAIDDYTPKKKTRRMISDIEGMELDFGEAWSGVAEPWRRWEQRERKPGLRISAEIFFAAGVPATTIADYGAWLMGLMQGLETKGYDLDVVLTLTCDRYYANDRYGGGRRQCQIHVTREGEQNDLVDWSALFSAGGTRHLGFTAMSMMAQRDGKRLTSHYATSLPSNDWIVGFDSDIRELRIDVPQRGSVYNQYEKPFDSERMDAAIKEVSDLLD